MFWKLLKMDGQESVRMSRYLQAALGIAMERCINKPCIVLKNKWFIPFSNVDLKKVPFCVWESEYALNSVQASTSPWEFIQVVYEYNAPAKGTCYKFMYGEPTNWRGVTRVKNVDAYTTVL